MVPHGLVEESLEHIVEQRPDDPPQGRCYVVTGPQERGAARRGARRSGSQA